MTLLADRSRIATAPISWGVCEVPGWGRMLSADRVLGEMAALGVRATELGAPGFLPDDHAALAATLARHEMQLIASFVPVVAHQPDAAEAVELVRAAAGKLGLLGGDVIVLALVEDAGWGPPHELSDAEWAQLAANLLTLERIAADEGLTLAIHPHVGTLIETDAQLRRALAETDCGWCLDTGHLFIGGTDPAAFAREHAERIVHVHLKDVDVAVADALRHGRMGLMEAVQAGLFAPLGEGDADVAGTLAELQRAGYDGWLVLEQDIAITGPEPAPGAGPALDVGRSVDFLLAGAVA